MGKDRATDLSNGGPVFDTLNGYQGVWHLTDVSDATYHLYSATNSAPAPTSVGANIANGYSCNGTSQYLTGIAASPANLSDWTEAAWVKTSSTSAGVVLSNRQNPNDRSVILHVGWWAGNPMGNGNAYFSSDGSGCERGAQGTSNIADGNWHFIAGTRSATSNYTVYVDGAPSHEQRNHRRRLHIFIGKCTHYLGNRPELAWNVTWNGSLDEVTMASVARSADWILLCYGTQMQNTRTVNLTVPIVWGPNDSLVAKAYQRDKDTGVINYRVTDPNSSTVTVSAEYKTAVGGSWTAITTATGSAGAGIDTIVTSNKSMRWKVSTEPGTGVEANYIIHVIATDGTNKDTSQSASFFIDTKAPAGLANLRPVRLPL